MLKVTKSFHSSHLPFSLRLPFVLSKEDVALLSSLLQLRLTREDEEVEVTAGAEDEDSNFLLKYFSR